MQEENRPLETLNDIKQLMDKSSRFISLSGWSGVAAGTCALLAAFVIGNRIECAKQGDCFTGLTMNTPDDQIQTTLLTVGALTFLVAAITAYFFTYLRS
ncbi:MAG TPA: hypothetical protein VM010_06850, partial [Chitinophagaceae bacterium]|nr:hypothetical protein [Chitinophagaceae bacterium]